LIRDSELVSFVENIFHNHTMKCACSAAKVQRSRRRPAARSPTGHQQETGDVLGEPPILEDVTEGRRVNLILNACSAIQEDVQPADLRKEQSEEIARLPISVSTSHRISPTRLHSDSDDQVDIVDDRLRRDAVDLAQLEDEPELREGRIRAEINHKE
jgi:hypothetical protein